MPCMAELPIVNVYLARETARRGDRDDAIPLMRAALDHLFREGQLLVWGTPATGVLVQTLLDRAADGDVAEAEAAIERLATAPADGGVDEAAVEERSLGDRLQRQSHHIEALELIGAGRGRA
jgi:hypothetical protein